jgi:hypothetical protein
VGRKQRLEILMVTVINLLGKANRRYKESKCAGGRKERKGQEELRTPGEG